MLERRCSYTSFRIGPDVVVIKGLIRHWEIKKIIDDLNQVLLVKNYNPIYYFEGSPSTEQEGMIITVRLSKTLTDEDSSLLKKLLEINGLLEESYG